MGINRENIAKVADIVRDALKLTIPVTLDGLLESVRRILSIKCDPVDDLNVDAEISTNSGSDSNDSQVKISYLENRPETRILFSISHEIGHLFLHLFDEDDKLIESSTYQRNLKTTVHELEANEFAAAFLMPKDDFIDKCRECMKDHVIDVDEVANYFNVSVQAATIRGNVLGLWRV